MDSAQPSMPQSSLCKRCAACSSGSGNAAINVGTPAPSVRDVHVPRQHSFTSAELSRRGQQQQATPDLYTQHSNLSHKLSNGSSTISRRLLPCRWRRRDCTCIVLVISVMSLLTILSMSIFRSSWQLLESTNMNNPLMVETKEPMEASRAPQTKLVPPSSTTTATVSSTRASATEVPVVGKRAEEPSTTAEKLTTTATTEATTEEAAKRASPAFPESHRSWAVLVQHEDVAARLSLSDTACNGEEASCQRRYLDPHFLPSWTLRAVDEDCTECTDTELYAPTVAGVSLQRRHAVFATSTAPLGRVGPMLFAMSSVTDEVDVAAELPKWGWMRHVYAGFAAPHTEAPPTAGVSGTPSYLAVMGVPSTDQPARVALREAQRATWLSYREVARSENGFHGALLPLYVFAAVEPSARRLHYRAFLPSALTPSVSDFKATAASLLHVGEEGADERTDETQGAFNRRRMVLRTDWQDKDVATTPCLSVEERPVTAGVQSTGLSRLSAALALPVTPAAVSAAEYICYASAELWQEALDHRNVVWVDMMTDRQPTTNKKLGEAGKWGLPVEVGMSQKLILWLEYAYHAFQDVPYIIKGDDDSYLKVPQFLSDIQYVRTGAQTRATVSPDNTFPTRLKASEAPAKADSHAGGVVECVYWGSTRSYRGTRFNAGMTFMAHRKLVQGVIGPVAELADSVDAVGMGVSEFNTSRAREYRRTLMDHEDIFLGLRIKASMRHAKEVCLHHRVWFVKEGYARMHDMHRGKVHNVTWSTVVAHRCTPADYYYLHYFFQKEHAYARKEGTGERQSVEKEEQEARRSAAMWVAEQGRQNAAAAVHEATSDAGWDNLPDVQWTHSKGGKRRPSFTVVPGDQVAVYNVPYEYWQHRATRVEDGYFSLPQR